MKNFSCEVIASILSGYPYANSEEIMEFLSSISESAKSHGGIKEYIYHNHPQLRGHLDGYDIFGSESDKIMFLEREIKLFAPGGSTGGFSFDIPVMSNTQTEEIQTKGKR